LALRASVGFATVGLKQTSRALNVLNYWEMISSASLRTLRQLCKILDKWAVAYICLTILLYGPPDLAMSERRVQTSHERKVRLNIHPIY